MIFLDFHHHKRNIPNGIYNSKIEETLPSSYFSIGLHPHEIDENWEEKFQKIKTISLHLNCLAIGECGLDGNIKVDEALQKEVFRQQILWANETQKPIIIHCVKRFSDLIPFQKIAKTPLIIHGFNKKKSIADEMLKHGFYLSFGKSVLHNVSLQAIVKDFPKEKMFLETDDADFEISELYQTVAQIKQTSVEDLQKQINKNLENINIIII
jgi:TatD DNase family protein